MRYEGIKSFYDFRQVTSEELTRDATKLIEVSDGSACCPTEILLFRTARPSMTAWLRSTPTR